jgi:membrane associated rhomboid family serine protease
MSQGIVALIDDGTDGTDGTDGIGWGLLVPTSDHPAAIEAIKLYRLENRHWRWRQPVPWFGFLFDWKISFWSLFLVAFYTLSHTTRPEIQIAGCMDNSAVWAGQWWRIFTAMLLHADIAHLLSNVTFATLLLGLTMGRYGSGLGLLASYLSGAAGNAVGLIVYPPSHLGLGASGMVMGGLGMLAIQSLKLLRQNPISRKYVLRALMAGLMLFVLFGLSPETDVVAHFVGFITGLLLGGILMSLPRSWRNPKINLAAGSILCGLVVVSGLLAFR